MTDCDHGGATGRANISGYPVAGYERTSSGSGLSVGEPSQSSRTVGE